MADFTADRGDAGRRIDQVLHERLPPYSRSRIQSSSRCCRGKVRKRVKKTNKASAAGSRKARPAPGSQNVSACRPGCAAAIQGWLGSYDTETSPSTG